MSSTVSHVCRIGDVHPSCWPQQYCQQPLSAEMSCSSHFKNSLNSTWKNTNLSRIFNILTKKTRKEEVNFPPKSSKNCLKQQVCYPCSKYFEYQYLDCYLCILAHVFLPPLTVTPTCSWHWGVHVLPDFTRIRPLQEGPWEQAPFPVMGKCSEWWGGSCHCKGNIYVLYSIYHIITYYL